MVDVEALPRPLSSPQATTCSASWFPLALWFVLEFTSRNLLIVAQVNVPALAAGVRDHGLMLATFGKTDDGGSVVENVDAVLSGGVFTMTDSSRRTAI